jgi:protein TonB
MVVSIALGVADDYGPARLRLTAACLASAALHLLFLLWMPVNPAGGVPGSGPSMIYARLAPAPAEKTEDRATVAIADADGSAQPGQVTETPAPKPMAEPQVEPASLQTRASPSAGIELPLIRDPTYYPAKQLDAYPEPLMQIRLQYPESAIADQVNGRLLLLLLIDESGVVSEVSAVEADPPGYFEEAARSAFSAMRFKPGMRQGRAVKCRVLVQVRYTYGESEGSVN